MTRSVLLSCVVAVTLAALAEEQVLLITAVVGAAVALLQYLRPRPREPLDVAEALVRERATLERQWADEASRRGLGSAPLMPLTLQSLRSGATVVNAPARPESYAGWGTAEWARYYARLTERGGPLFRAVVFGEGGTGKSTLALLVTQGLFLAGRFPLYLPLARWQDEQHFWPWVEREVASQHPALAQALAATRNTLYDVVVRHPQMVFVLDGADEIDEDHWKQAVTRLYAEIPPEHPALVFARPGPDPVSQAGGFTPLLLPPRTPSEVRACLHRRAAGTETVADWQPVLRRLGRAPEGPVSDLLRLPFHLDLVWRVYGPRATTPPAHVPATLDRWAELAERDGPSAREALMDGYLQEGLRQFPAGQDARLRRLPGGADRALERLAYWARARSGPRSPGELAWWRLITLVPPAVPVGACALLLVLTYWPAIFMPKGFTRGLAIGITTAVTLALLRDTRPRRPAEVTAALAAGGAVAAVGAACAPGGGAVDGLQLGSAFLLVLLLRPRLTAGPRNALPAALACCAVPAALMAAARAVLGARPPAGGFWLDVLLSMATGIGLATVTVHLLADVRRPREPTHITFTHRRELGPPLRHVLHGTLPACGMGWLAGLTLMRQSPEHALALTVVFGLIFGPPLGLVAGLLNWANQPRSLREGATAQGSWRNDRLVAAGCVLGTALLTTLIVLGLRYGPGQVLLHRIGTGTLRLQPWHGVFLGLTVGLVLAALHTAALPTALAHAWLALHGRLPWRAATFLHALHRREILRQHGRTYQFRHQELADHLARRRNRAGRGPG
ncbi:hypothetical protein [Streptomyces sp. NPDC007100]|uniref:hypothetical protein n=1 Tax=Streptomyces sp. NPDC007100 TaxID=3155602 RepID=UPI0033D3CF56